MMRRALPALAFALWFFGHAVAGAQELSAKHQSWLQEAAQDAFTDMHFARLASNQGLDVSVRTFAKMYLEDSAQRSARLIIIAAANTLILPQRLEDGAAEQLEKLSKMPPRDFERAFLKQAITDLQSDVQTYETMSRNGGSQTGTVDVLKQFAKTELPALKLTLAQARELADARALAEAHEAERRGTSAKPKEAEPD